MASMWRRTMVYLGLQDDESEYGPVGYGAQGDYEDAATGSYAGGDGNGVGEEPEPVGSRPPAGPPRGPVVAAGRGRDDGPPRPGPSVVRTIGPTTATRVQVVEPQGFNDAQEVGDRLKANQPVIINLQGLSRELQRRLIDFSSGLAYAVGGQMARVGDQVFLLKPVGVEVSQEERERLQARGLYQA